MNVTRSRFLLGLAAVLAGVVSMGSAPAAAAAPVPVKVNLNALRCIQTYSPTQRDDDQVYLTVSGVAKGTDVTKRIPESGTLPANTKKPAVSEKAPATLWEGELADGEFALLTVTLYQGKGDDAAKAFAGQLDSATKSVAERSKKTLAGDDAKNLAAATVKAQQGVVTKVTESLARTKNTDHFGGMFNVLVWNNNGTLVKRLDPVGLTFGEHYGDKEKAYSKIKFTRMNVLVPEGEGEDAEWFPQVFPPLTEDKLTARVKMLETEFWKEGGRVKKNVTDYLADLQVLAGGKPVEWKLGGENPGPTQTHHWWEYAE